MFVELKTKKGETAYLSPDEVVLILPEISGGSEVHLRGKSTRVHAHLPPEEVVEILRNSSGGYTCQADNWTSSA